MHANKMILVPHEIMGDETSQKYISALDQGMLSILNDKTIPMDAKIIHYNQVLRRYQTTKQDIEKPFQLEIKEPEIKEKPIIIEQPNDQEILGMVPKQWRNKASTLLAYVRKNPHIKWSDKNEMIIDGNKIVNSNIIDLINDLSRNRKSQPAVGADILMKKLLEDNIPRESIVNKSILSLGTPDIYVSPKPDESPNSTPKQHVGKLRGAFKSWVNL